MESRTLYFTTHADLQLGCWIVMGFEVLGLLSTWLARRSVGARGQRPCQWLYALCLIMVGASTVVAMTIGPACWLSSTATLAIMILAVVWDSGAEGPCLPASGTVVKLLPAPPAPWVRPHAAGTRRRFFPKHWQTRKKAPLRHNRQPKYLHRHYTDGRRWPRDSVRRRACPTTAGCGPAACEAGQNRPGACINQEGEACDENSLAWRCWPLPR